MIKRPKNLVFFFVLSKQTEQVYAQLYSSSSNYCLIPLFLFIFSIPLQDTKIFLVLNLTPNNDRYQLEPRLDSDTQRQDITIMKKQ